MAHKNTFYKKQCVGSITLPTRLIFCQNKDKPLVYLYRKNCNASSSVSGDILTLVKKAPKGLFLIMIFLYES